MRTRRGPDVVHHCYRAKCFRTEPETRTLDIKRRKTVCQVRCQALCHCYPCGVAFRIIHQVRAPLSRDPEGALYKFLLIDSSLIAISNFYCAKESTNGSPKPSQIYF